MAKKVAAGGFVSPANLWGKPLPGLGSETEAPKKPARSDAEAAEADADDELEEDETDDNFETGSEETDNEAAYAAAEQVDPDEDDDADDDVGDDDETDDEIAATDSAADDSDDADTEEENGSGEEDSDPVLVENTSSTNPKKVITMSEKKTGADFIREEIAKRQEKGASLRGVDIVAALEKKNVTVSAAQVSQLLKKAGVSSGRGVGRPARATVGAEEPRSRIAGKTKRQTSEVPVPRSTPKAKAKPATGGVSHALPMTQLKAAATFLEACGGCYDTAEEILSAHQQLYSMMAK